MSKISSIEFLNYYRGKINSLLELLDDESLTFRPNEKSNTLGWELRHIADVEEIYILAISKGAGPSWSDKREEEMVAKSISRLREFYHEVEKQYLKLFNDFPMNLNREISWSEMGGVLDLEDCMNYWIHFLCERQGVLALYISSLGLEYDFS